MAIFSLTWGCSALGLKGHSKNSTTQSKPEIPEEQVKNPIDSDKPSDAGEGVIGYLIDPSLVAATTAEELIHIVGAAGAVTGPDEVIEVVALSVPYPILRTFDNSGMEQIGGDTVATAPVANDGSFQLEVAKTTLGNRGLILAIAAVVAEQSLVLQPESVAASITIDPQFTMAKLPLPTQDQSLVQVFSPPTNLPLPGDFSSVTLADGTILGSFGDGFIKITPGNEISFSTLKEPPENQGPIQSLILDQTRNLVYFTAQTSIGRKLFRAPTAQPEDGVAISNINPMGDDLVFGAAALIQRRGAYDFTAGSLYFAARGPNFGMQVFRTRFDTAMVTEADRLTDFVSRTDNPNPTYFLLEPTTQTLFVNGWTSDRMVAMSIMNPLQVQPPVGSFELPPPGPRPYRQAMASPSPTLLAAMTVRP